MNTKEDFNKSRAAQELWLSKKNWKEKIEHIKIPSYLKDDLEEYFKYIKEGNNIMYSAVIDNVIASINVAEQEKDLTSEEAKYIRKIL
ncbi:hypothetical protein EGX98_03140 [Fusobacterium necrophorum]|uniref:Uncharacterized protein n=2 Tax=Fusobacterium necrophorum TaxID=859 RepID=A0AB73BUP5_9FUSO|nr:hypothetical protein [Fusobacterium necrophorum]AYZ73130.1 hypothetical protein EGX98_03140 [Fusobacterium necrophorum]AZW08873.1 hypothetical protein EO219_04270 [Fusobacterium necrophorum subsp. necrophorum]KDE61703.1 hypothetical protein FUSO5_11140 [Fusobacterium necrophorum BFTR-1]KDE62033.1 hypothetical protein FUSO3_09285 [Fusobacterium necrophorum BL]KDE67344.1 hypothetical protein FUSO4_03190 [Fusobacterium necrophorum DJ-1]